MFLFSILFYLVVSIIVNQILLLNLNITFFSQKTDQLIQSTLREKFSECTVLTIAHRINTIIDSDRVMVMDAGELVEFDHPAVLLQRPESIFYDLVKETGMFDELLEQANAARRKASGGSKSGSPVQTPIRLNSDAFSDVQL